MIKSRYFILSLLGLCAFYLGFELFYNNYSMLSVDEFWFAHRIYQYKNALPYLDFAPYKTVLGYYLLLPPMLVNQGALNTLIFTKHYITLLNTIILFISSLWLRRFFSGLSILSSLVFVIFSEIALSYTSQIRVDLLGYWFCFFALLLILEKRYLIAGICIGLGFAVTQKAIWYILACNAALFLTWAITSRQIKALSPMGLFNLAIVMVVLSYLGFWSYIADWHTVIHSVFDEASAMYQLDWYDAARLPFWRAIVLFNFWIFFLWPITLLSILVTDAEDIHYTQRVFIVICSFVILLCLIPYKQVFPYYMQVCVPILLLLYAAFFNWAIHLFSKRPAVRLLVPKNLLWGLVGSYMLVNGWLVFSTLHLPMPGFYLLIDSVPITLVFYCTYQSHLSYAFGRGLFHIMAAVALVLGVVYPWRLFSLRLENLAGRYQQANINTMAALLNEGGDYVAGIELIYTKTQPIAGMRHLMGPAIDFLYSPTPKLKQVMLASLYEDPNATTGSVITALKNSNIKFYINNYRMMALPKKIKQFLTSEYQHWWGSIYLYAPQVASGKQTLQLKFSGPYKIETVPKTVIYLNHQALLPGSVIYCKKGIYSSISKLPYRLALIPKTVPSSKVASFQQDRWNKLLF